MSILGILAGAGCYEPSVDKDALGDALGPPIGLFDDGGVGPRDGGGGGGPDAAAGCDSSPLSALRIVVRTTAVGGRYAPKNIGAIWIETAAGQYVKTVKRWANRRLRYLTRYNAAAGGDVTDAITGATLTSHTTHDVTWNLTDRARCEVPAGTYQVALRVNRTTAAVALGTLAQDDEQFVLPSGVPVDRGEALTLRVAAGGADLHGRRGPRAPHQGRRPGHRRPPLSRRRRGPARRPPTRDRRVPRADARLAPRVAPSLRRGPLRPRGLHRAAPRRARLRRVDDREPHAPRASRASTASSPAAGTRRSTPWSPSPRTPRR